MMTNNLHTNPLCKKEQFGEPIPNDDHAISVCLPTWEDIVNYEEREPDSIKKLKAGYPRFVYHPQIDSIHEKFNKNSNNEIQLYPTYKAARRAVDFLISKNPKANIKSYPKSNVYVVEFPKSSLKDAKLYWQLSGEGISSRCASSLLSSKKITKGNGSDYEKVKEKLSKLLSVDSCDIYIFPSGMSAIYTAMNAVKKIFPDRKFCQFGFPYGDTLKLLENFNSKNTLFYPNADEIDLKQFEKIVSENPIAGLFTEFPSNPLLKSADLKKIRKLANDFHFPIVTDETLGALLNTNANLFSDISTISLTKYFSGEGNVMSGALIINPDQPFYHLLKPLIESEFEEEMLFEDDIKQLNKNSVNILDRISTINHNTLEIVNYLKHHKAIEQIWHPSITDTTIYNNFKKSDNGCGGVLSFVLKNAPKKTCDFYDKIAFSKGPNLGTTYSLCCPFVMLAHYNELEWAEKMGASRWLIRLSIGLEPPENLIDRLNFALS